MPATAEPPNGPKPVPGEDDDVKRKFREALERKNARHTGGDGGEGKDNAKVHGGAHGPAHQQRTFRRKSG